MPTTANDLILGALKFISVYSPGESLAAEDSSDALETLNDLLESWSTDQASVFASSETLLTFIPGQYQYTIGNYDGGTFAGTVTNGSPTITGVTIPTGMIPRGDLTGVGIPAGTTILAVGATTITMSANATLTPGTPLQIGFTIPGDFKMARPLRISNSFTRITTVGTSGLDYPIEVVDQQKYNQIGYKGISAPWPIVMWYNPTYPLGNLYFYQNPSGAGSLHLFTDNILTNLATLTTAVVLPQGYSRFIKRQLARELAPEYGAQWTQMHEKLAKESWDMVKSLNMVPQPVAKYDTAISRGNQRDAGWILTGGFR